MLRLALALAVLALTPAAAGATTVYAASSLKPVLPEIAPGVTASFGGVTLEPTGPMAAKGIPPEVVNNILGVDTADQLAVAQANADAAAPAEPRSVKHEVKHVTTV